MRSKRFRTALAAAVTAASSVVSTACPSARSPSSCAAAATPAASRSHSATDAPDACRRAAIARPKPPAPPVMMAVRPVKSYLTMEAPPARVRVIGQAAGRRVDRRGERNYTMGGAKPSSARQTQNPSERSPDGRTNDRRRRAAAGRCPHRAPARRQTARLMPPRGRRRGPRDTASRRGNARSGRSAAGNARCRHRSERSPQRRFSRRRSSAWRPARSCRSPARRASSPR